ncbi:MAG: hypothetical protein R3284_01150 [Rubricoccaceae bacterium]|nr:hypothetical protein [Rubricoccaceae bacterium]
MKTAFFLLVVFGTLALFNPDEADFALHVREKAQTAVSDQARSLDDSFLIPSDTPTSALAQAHASGAFERNNFVVFSLFKADLDGAQLQGGEWTFLGIGKQFFQLSKPSTFNS